MNSGYKQREFLGWSRIGAQRTPETQTRWRRGESSANPSLGAGFPVEQGRYREISALPAS
jgi:hypothetical protein